MAEWLRQALRRRRPVLLKAWARSLAASPQAGIPADRGRNVLSAVVADGLAAWFDALLAHDAPPAVSAAAERLIRIRAVQDRLPGEALAFFGDLKGLLRRELEGEMRDRQAWEELRALEDRIDALTRAAFDRYLACREEAFRIRLREWQDRTARILAWTEKKGLVPPAGEATEPPGAAE